jgi:hypothetical protein
VGEPIEQGGGHLGVTEDAGPLTEAEVGCDDDAGSLVKLTEQVEEQSSTRGAEWQISEFVENDEIGVNEPPGDLPRLPLGLLLFEDVDQFDRGEEADPLAIMLDRVHPKGGGDVRLSGAGTADQNDVVCVFQEFATMQLTHERLVHLAAGKVEAVEVAVDREASGVDRRGKLTPCWG